MLVGEITRNLVTRTAPLFFARLPHSNYCQTAIEKLINSETKTPRQSRSAHAFVFSPKTKQYGGHSFSFQEYLGNILQSKCGIK